MNKLHFQIKLLPFYIKLSIYILYKPRHKYILMNLLVRWLYIRNFGMFETLQPNSIAQKKKKK